MVIENFKKFWLEGLIMMCSTADSASVLQWKPASTELGWVALWHGGLQSTRVLVTDLKMVSVHGRMWRLPAWPLSGFMCPAHLTQSAFRGGALVVWSGKLFWRTFSIFWLFSYWKSQLKQRLPMCPDAIQCGARGGGQRVEGHWLRINFNGHKH